MNSKVLVIVGMHRSGTSVITQWLYRCGLFIGNDLVGPDTGNEQGHFEDVDFLRLHQKFLKKRHFPETGLVYKKPVELSELEKMELKGMIETKSRKNKEWGWKEPRTSLFLDGYSKIIPGAFYVVVVRDFNSTINSLINRHYKLQEKRFQQKKGLSRIKWQLFKRKSLEKIFERETDHYLKIWIHYYDRILEHIRSLPPGRFVVVNYHELIKNDTSFFSKLKNDWQFSLEYLPFVNVYDNGLLSEVRDTTKYIKNKKLEARAIAIEEMVTLK